MISRWRPERKLRKRQRLAACRSTGRPDPPAIEARFAAHRGTADLPRLRWQTLAGIEPGWEDEWREPGVDAGFLAFLQFTSGSTGDPKGVQVSHGNLLSNQEAIRTAFGQSRDSVIVAWLPLYHDMD